MTTVGYGDYSGGTLVEQLYCIGLMICGVIVFTMVSGSLASILASLDTANAELTEKVMFLKRLEREYDLPADICKGINKSLIYDSRMATAGLA